MIRTSFEKDAMRGRWLIHIVDQDPITRVISHWGNPIVMEPSGNPGVMHPPAIVLGVDEIQELMDEMWIAGLRPSSMSAPSDLIEAKDKHLSDLRASHQILLEAFSKIHA